MGFFLGSPGGGIGRHAGLKILFAATRVRVQFPPGAHINITRRISASYFFYNPKTIIKNDILFKEMFYGFRFFIKD